MFCNWTKKIEKIDEDGRKNEGPHFYTRLGVSNVLGTSQKTAMHFYKKKYPTSAILLWYFILKLETSGSKREKNPAKV